MTLDISFKSPQQCKSHKKTIENRDVVKQSEQAPSCTLFSRLDLGILLPLVVYTGSLLPILIGIGYFVFCLVIAILMREIVFYFVLICVCLLANEVEPFYHISQSHETTPAKREVHLGLLLQLWFLIAKIWNSIQLNNMGKNIQMTFLFLQACLNFVKQMLGQQPLLLRQY